MSSFSARHEPRSLSDFVFEDPTTETMLQQYAAKQCDGNIILHGPHGTGKSSLAKIIVETRAPSGQALFWNNNFVYHARTLSEDTFDKILLGTWNIQSSGNHRPYCVIDEVDQLSVPFRERLRAFMDQHETVGCFIMTTNHLHSVDPGIADRSERLEVPTAKPLLWRTRGKAILQSEGVKCSDAQLDALLATTDGSVRDILRALERASIQYHAKNQLKSQSSAA